MTRVKQMPKSNDDKAERAFFKALKENGFIFPESEEEIQKLKAKLLSEEIIIPDVLDDPDAILKRGLIKKIEAFDYNDKVSEETEQNLARAAREGKRISQEVEKRMKKDRSNAEEKEPKGNKPRGKKKS